MNKQTSMKEHVCKSLQKNYDYILDRLDLDTNFDIDYRSYKVGNRDLNIYFCSSLTNTPLIVEILKQFSIIDRTFTSVGAFKELLDHALPHVQVETVDQLDEAIDKLLSGLILIFGETWEKVIIVDVREYPGRQPEEPDTERVVRGSRDGYTENLLFNTGLTRRRIRDERLRMEMLRVGERSKTDVCISYIKDISDPELIDEIKQKIEKINIDGIPMAEKAIEEFVVGQGYHPFPKVRFTERPDVAAAHLFEGHIIIFVDTSPSVIILPTTYFHHLQHAEEFRQAPALGVYLRWIRFFGVLTSLFLLPLWLLFVINPELLPPQLEFLGPEKQDFAVPIFWQFIFAELGVDLMRMAAIHTPSPLATAMGLIAAILIGEIAINVGIFIPEVILYLAIAAIGGFATPSYEMGLANKFIRIALLIFVYAFGIPGFVITATVILVYLASLKSMKTPYLWPFIPFNLKALITILLRVTTSMTKTRPSIVHPRNKRKQPVQ